MRVSCTCSETNALQICKHVYIAFFHVKNKSGEDLLLRYCDFDVEKNAILKKYALTLDDPEAKLFQFGNDQWGQVVLRFKPPEFVELKDEKDLHLFNIKFIGQKGTKIATREKSIFATNEANLFSVGLVFGLASTINMPFRIDACKVTLKKEGQESITKLSINDENNYPLLANLSDKNLKPLPLLVFQNSMQNLKS